MDLLSDFELLIAFAIFTELELLTKILPRGLPTGIELPLYDLVDLIFNFSDSK
jgi:hypothetical protein